MTESYKEHSKAIKHLTQNAKNGTLAAQLQLHENYAKGKYVNKDEKLSQQFFQQLEESLIGKKLRLKSLQLYQFKKFHQLNIDFNKKMTVIIGDNGAGKTSIVEAISKIFTWFNNNLYKAEVNGSPVSPSDINLSSTDYAEIVSNFDLGKKNKFQASLTRTVPGFGDSHKSNIKEIKEFASMYRLTAKNPSIIIPLLAFYSVERSDFKLPLTVTEKTEDDKISNRFTALEHALKGNGGFNTFSELYIQLVNLADGENTKKVNHLNHQISTLQNLINEVYEGKNPPESDPFKVKLNAKKEELTLLLKPISSSKYRRHLDFVNLAITTLIPDVKHLEVDRSLGKPRILVDIEGKKINISQLSQGQKTLIALAFDIARRLVTLNPLSDMPLAGHGIVVIDEVELHLHPLWQQSILIGLQEVFPNIQFIVTTHSPQVLSTVDNTCIRQMCFDENGNTTIKTPTFQTKGVISADILARIMGTNPVPEELEEAKWVDDFSASLIAQNQTLVDKYFKKILRHFGQQHPVVLECESQIRIAEMKIRLAKHT